MSYIWGMKNLQKVNAKLLHYKYDRSSLFFKSIFVYLNLMIIHESNFFLHIHNVICVFIIAIVRAQFYRKNFYVVGF
jgi:hypothetical protein